MADKEPKQGILDFFKRGFIANKVGDKLSIEIEASSFAVQYRKTIKRPTPIAMLYVNKNRVHPIALNANFEEDWGECLFIQPIFHHEEKKKHLIEIEITRTSEADITPFYLMAFIVS